MKELSLEEYREKMEEFINGQAQEIISMVEEIKTDPENTGILCNSIKGKLENMEENLTQYRKGLTLKDEATFYLVEGRPGFALGEEEFKGNQSSYLG